MNDNLSIYIYIYAASLVTSECASYSGGNDTSDDAERWVSTTPGNVPEL